MRVCRGCWVWRVRPASVDKRGGEVANTCVSGPCVLKLIVATFDCRSYSVVVFIVRAWFLISERSQQSTWYLRI